MEEEVVEVEVPGGEGVWPSGSGALSACPLAAPPSYPPLPLSFSILLLPLLIILFLHSFPSFDLFSSFISFGQTKWGKCPSKIFSKQYYKFMDSTVGCSLLRSLALLILNCHYTFLGSVALLISHNQLANMFTSHAKDSP